MATAADLILLKNRRQTLARYGVSFTPIYNPSPKHQWYRKDGTALPNLLPADPHHIKLYERHGWSMIPPDRLKVAELVVAEPVVAELVVAEPVTVNGSAPHVHQYAMEMGSPCKHRGCISVRETEYRKRKAKKRRK